MKRFRAGMWLILGAIIVLGVSAVPAQANLISNGSFELGVAPGSFTTLGTGSTNITGWAVDGSIDYIGSYWQAADGARSIDMNGYYAIGSISQTFATTLNQAYRVEFYMAGNPDGAPVLKTLVASGGSLTGQQFSFDVSGHTHNDMGWERRFFDFIASGTSTTLTFSSDIVGGAFGAALDKVSVNAVPEPGTLLLLGSGLLGLTLAGARKKFRE